MGLFIGTKEYSVDDKGRVATPVMHRAELKDVQLVAYEDLNNKCVKLVTYDFYIKFVEKYTKLTVIDKHVERILDRIVGRAEYTKLDSQGRITLSQKLRQAVQIKSSVSVVGKFDHFELWATELREVYESGATVDSDFQDSLIIVNQRLSDKDK